MPPKTSRKAKSKKSGAKKKPRKNVAKKRQSASAKIKKTLSKRPSHLRQSKTDNFLEKIRNNNPMIEYIMNLRILNPAAQLLSKGSGGPKREGGFVRLAHAREEFPAPILNKGKAYEAMKRENRAKARGARLKK